MKNVLLLLVLLVVMSNCSLDKPEHVTDIFPPSTILQHTIVAEDVFELPIDMILSHDDLIVKDLKSDSIMAVYNLTAKKITQRFLRFGQGPGETIDYPASLYMINDTTLIWLDAMSRIRHAVFSTDKRTIVSMDKSCDIDRELSLMRMVPLSDKGYVAVGLIDKGRYALLDKQGEVKSYLYDYPNDNVPIEPRMKGFIYQGGFVSNADHTRFASYTYNSEVIEFFTINAKGSFEKVKEYHFDYANYAPSSPIPTIEDGSLYFVNGCATNKYVYMLYVGRKVSESRSLISGKTVLVFDWKGKPIRRFELTTEVTALAVDANDGIMYATTNQPEGAILSIKLK